MAESGKFAARLSTREEVTTQSHHVGATEAWRKPLLILCLIFWVINLAFTILGMDSTGLEGWLEGSFLCLVTLSTLVALGRRLPLQNVFATAVLVCGVSGLLVSLSSVSGVPFGPLRYTASFGEKIFNILPWPAPLGWIFLVVNGRGVARLIMRPWRQTNYYGFWVMGVTCLLAVLFDLGLEPYAVTVKGYWIWQTPKSVPAWYTAPWVNFMGWFVAVLAALVIAMPWLINKHPLKQPVDYYPVVLWLMFALWICVGNARHQLWPAVVVSLAGNVIAAVLAIRGALYGAEDEELTGPDHK